MKNITVASLVAAPLLALAMAMPSFADTTCKDGTTTTSTGKGTCSGHGGIQKAAAAATAAPAAAAPVAATPKTPATPAAGAATTCKDGTTTASTGKGTCSGHGGIQKATKAKPATAAMAPAPAAAPAAAAPAPAAAPAASTTAAKTSTATKSAPVATASNTDPTGASAKCKDGTYSKSQHRSGTCSSHGGVAEWLAGAPAQ
jgi:Protein of unknown function (DUF3761)